MSTSMKQTNQQDRPDASATNPDQQPPAAPHFSGPRMFLQAALFWFKHGLKVIPVVPATKQTAAKWNPWLNKLSTSQIERHWRNHPDHELGFIVSDDLIVFDGDSTAAVEAMKAAEARLGIEPLLVVATKRGEHHYYRRDPQLAGARIGRRRGAIPEHLDIKTGRTMVILPPSTGKSIEKLGGFHA